MHHALHYVGPSPKTPHEAQNTDEPFPLVTQELMDATRLQIARELLAGDKRTFNRLGELLECTVAELSKPEAYLVPSPTRKGTLADDYMRFLGQLIECGANVNAMGGLALAEAIVCRLHDVERMLVDAGADRRAAMRRALITAAAGGHTEILKIVIAAGADLDADGREALRQARRNRRTSAVAVLISAGVPST